MKDKKALDVFLSNPSMNVVNLFLENARKPKDHYETKEVRAHAWGGPGKFVNFTAILTPDMQRTDQERKRQEYLEKHCGNEHVDFDTLENDTITVRDRDTMQQIRMPIAELAEYVEKKIRF